MWGFLHRLFGSKPPAAELKAPTSGPPSQPQSGLERIGPHVIRNVLAKRDDGLLLSADYGGDPDQRVYIQRYPYLAQAIAEDLELQARLTADLATVRQIQHKYLYPLKDACTEGDVYLVCDMIPILTLQDVLDQITLTPTEAVAYVERLLELASDLHERGFKLGDIKPSAVWLTPSKEPRLLTGQWILEYESQRLTERMTASRSDIHRGGVDYLPPEVIRGEAISYATDQYILGAILFHLLTKKSVAGDDALTFHKVMRIVGEAPPKASQVHPTLGAAFDPILERMLAKDPGQRFENCALIIPALREALSMS